MEIAPIALFVYSRLEHTKKVVEALKENDLAKESKLFIFSDGPKTKEQRSSVSQVREYIKTINGFKSVKIFESKKNKGLASSIIYGVTKIVNKYGKIIVLEDDIVTSKYFLKFMNEALEKYKNEKKVISISGYTYPIKNLPETFFINGINSWGWATWKRAWKDFEFDGEKLLFELKNRNLESELNYNDAYPYLKMLEDQINGNNNSWAIRWYASNFLKKKLTLYPGKSLVLNIGVDGTGFHGGKVNVFKTSLSKNEIIITEIPIVEDTGLRKLFELFFNKIKSKRYKTKIFVESLFSQDF